MNDEEQALLYEAGYMAGRLDWPDIDVVSTSEIASVAPSGGPAIVVCGQESLTVEQARALAAVSGAGRAIRLVTTHRPPEEVAAWLPTGSIHVIGKDVTATPATTVIGPPHPWGYSFEAASEQEGRGWELNDGSWLDDAAKTALAAAMREVKVGVAWDRHILMTGDTGWFRVGDSADLPVKGLSKAVVDYSDYEFIDVDLLSGLGASLTLNIRILDQVILLICGPFNYDFGNNSYCVTASTELKLCLLQEGPGISVSSLGDVPERFRRIPGGRDCVENILGSWANGFFGLIQREGEFGFCRIGVDCDDELQKDWDQCVAFLEGR